MTRQESVFTELCDALSVFSDCESDSDAEIHRNERRRQHVSRLLPFYAKRKDLYFFYDDDDVIRTFRFDKPSIAYIIGNSYSLSDSV